MSIQARYDAEDAALWRKLVQCMESDRIRVVMRGDGPGAAGRTAGMYASDIDEVIEHISHEGTCIPD